MKHVFICLTFFGVGMAIATPARAGVLGMEVPNPRAISGTFNATLGWSFTANQDILVDGLGFWDFLSDGLKLPHQVGLWNSDGSVLLASTTIAAGTGSPLIEDFRFEAITPVLLAAGQEYVLGAFLPPDPTFSGIVEPYNYEQRLNSTTLQVTFASEISYLRSRHINSPVFEFPLGIDSATNLGSFGPNLTFSSAAVPETASLVLWSLLSLASVGAASPRGSARRMLTSIRRRLP